MRGKLLLFTLVGLTIGFIAGFFVANLINRSEINDLRSELGAEKSTPAAPSEKETLSSDEIRAKIKEADDNPENLSYQKNLGLALYRYAAIQNDLDVVAEAARLLERASKLAPDDQDIVVGTGNAWFDIGYIKKDNAAFQKARTYYEKALSKNVRDANVRVDLGMTYFLETPPNDLKAIEEFRRSLSVDPKNEKALEFIVQSYLRMGDHQSANTYLTSLRESYPSNPSITALAAQIGSSVPEAK